MNGSGLLRHFRQAAIEVHSPVTTRGACGFTLQAMNKRLLLGLAGLLTALLLQGCFSSAPVRSTAFKPIEKANAVEMNSKESIAQLEELEQPVYTIGRGDVLNINAVGRPELSGRQVVGPDGHISVPVAGEISVWERTREDAREAIERELRQYYTYVRVTLSVDEYVSNFVTVLGRVERAGMQKFPHPPTLAEVLAGAGAMPILDKQATLTRCTIMRGRDKLIWVDLKALLNGDPAYNMRMKRGDVVFIPDSADTAIYVMGQVIKPGSYRLTPRMTLLDAIAQAGGLHEDANTKEIGIYRAGIQQIQVIAMDQLIDPSRSVNFAMEDGDVVFVPRSGLGEFGYMMRQISPSLGILNFGVTLKALEK